MKLTENIIYRDLKVYTTTEWLADNKKNYRSVFDETECSYVYCEFSFINLNYKKENWHLKLNLVCRDHEKKEICSLNCDRDVSKNQNTVFIREGWGTRSAGSFWKPGVYVWEAYIDGELIGEKAFYIQNYGLITKNVNHYFEVNGLDFYEGPSGNILVNQRIYFNTFKADDTRYVWAEFNFKNNLQLSTYWICELIFNFRNSRNQLKGSVTKLFFVYPDQKDLSITVGWGSDNLGSWNKDTYYLDVIFLDKIIYNKNFTLSDDYKRVGAEEKEIPLIKAPKSQTKTNENIKSENIEDVMKELDALIGLEEVKEKIKEYSKYINFLALRQNKGIEESEKISLHSVFKGNPGTGKTTVARKLGKIYKRLGLLSKGHVYEADRTELVAEYIGQTAPKTKAAIKKAKGGILFIDEAYALARQNDDAKDFGKEAIEILLKELSDGEDIAIIVAGYPNEMDTFINSNPGLKSRFTMSIDFPDYTPQELMQIAEYAAKNRGVEFSPIAKELFYKKLVDAYRERDKFFGNARLVNSLVEECKMNLGIRVMESKDPKILKVHELSIITEDDVEKISITQKRKKADIPIDEELLSSSLNKLNQMIGLESVKTEISELVKLVRFYKETGKDIRNTFSLHSVFTGNPGTGKTTVARILAQIYKALGILERGKLIECDRQSLVGGYVGQTAIKTAEIIDRAMGGVLFIDEAYSLTEGGNSDYGKEAIEIILKRMEDFRGEFIVIAAGYTENMRRFLESNPGLKSRFDKTLHFEDFDPQELMHIAENQLTEYNMKLTSAAHNKLFDTIEEMYSSRDKYFGNGRSVRKLIEQIVKKQYLRMASLSIDERSEKIISSVNVKDLDGLEITKASKYTGSIGFKANN